MPAKTPTTALLSIELLNLADQCVLCGLCLPACPTYRVERTEAESPRGRIALAKAQANGDLTLDSQGLAHLEHCLGCLSCERACPSGVKYGRIIDMAREQAATAPDRFHSLLYAAAAHPGWIRLAARLSQVLRLSRWLAPLGRRRSWRWVAQIPPLPAVPHMPVATPPQTRGRIGLFLGCVATAFDRDTHAAARHLLQALGYAVVEPQGQACCGALAQHAGQAAIAAKLASPTRAAFVGSGVETVLVTASGCYGTLRDLTFAETAIHVREIGEFLASDAQLATLQFAPLAGKAALHLPCSLTNRVRAAGATHALLQRIPQLTIVELPEQPRCCGAGGTNFLRFAATSDALRDEQLDGLQSTQATLLLTSNIGCRLHLGAGLRERGAALEVMHPITLLARQLVAAGSGAAGESPRH
ncbi:glycolate oxidase iron-sulfur subunit [Tahibacter aquaticus]|uniref:Glycolate oxidase iron-sulfur subunit n=1 Tax=Tahibacter aquaticus TaxID=520092 RepID=A0A4R6YPP6_9GAMM|nr:(Fe-S)-binding protein [Tahibacter aquaticus]TDR39624.1 glycolate oxidase iron-sulfur subunit [Tahibacter aquaticus]